jgi:hypothetical protein
MNTWYKRYLDLIGLKYPGDSIFIKKNPEFCSSVLNATSKCSSNLPILSRVLLLDMGLEIEPPCIICGNKSIWWKDPHNPSSGWKDHTCSASCSRRAVRVLRGETLIEKQKQTVRNRYGVENVATLKEVQETIKKTNLERFGTEASSRSLVVQEKKLRTIRERYGVDNVMQVDNIREKVEKTCLEKFGFKHAASSETVKDATKKTNLDLYGCPYPMQNIDVKRKRLETFRERFSVDHPMQTEEYKVKLKSTLKVLYGTRKIGWRYKCPTDVAIEKLKSREFWNSEHVQNKKSLHQIARELNTTSSTVAIYFFKYSGLPKILIRSGVSSEEQNFFSFLESKISGILQSIPLSSLGGKSKRSLDAYIPQLNLAFEYNGVYWHSEKFRSSREHLEKTLECEKLGIRLIHVWSDDWIFKQELVKKKICSLLGLEFQKVYARKCAIVSVDSKKKKNFYSTNHIKGDGVGSISYGLQYGGQLVALITFKNIGKGIYDLNRYATSCSVVGGFSKLLSHFKKNTNWSKIYTYADRSWSRGDVYLKTGFTFLSEIPPSFHGLEKDRRVNRLNYTHKKLSRRFPTAVGTQDQIMSSAGILRIWDCGQLKFGVTNHG